MGVTRRAARIAFAVLLLGAGAATVAARPTSPLREVNVVKGDERLDLAWALTESGMSSEDAHRVSVVLVDGIDPSGENEAMSITRGAELWWRTVAEDGGTTVNLMRVRLEFGWSTRLRELVANARCSESDGAFIAVRTTATSPAPIPPGSVVLIRLLAVWATPHGGHVRAAAFEPLAKSGPTVECQPLGVDHHHGIKTPTRWPVAP